MFHAAMGRLLRAAIMPGPLLYTPLNIILAVWVAVQLLLRKFADIAVVPTTTFQTLESYILWNFDEKLPSNLMNSVTAIHGEVDRLILCEWQS